MSVQRDRLTAEGLAALLPDDDSAFVAASKRSADAHLSSPEAVERFRRIVELSEAGPHTVDDFSDLLTPLEP